MSTYLGAFCTNAKYSFICSPGISLLKPKQDMCVCACVYLTNSPIYDKLPETFFSYGNGCFTRSTANNPSFKFTTIVSPKNVILKLSF